MEDCSVWHLTVALVVELTMILDSVELADCLVAPAVLAVAGAVGLA